MKYSPQICFCLRIELLVGAPYKVASAARERLWELALSLQRLGQLYFRPAAFAMGFHMFSYDFTRFIRLHKSADFHEARDALPRLEAMRQS